MRKFLLASLTMATLASPLAAQTYRGEIFEDRREVDREYRDLQNAREYGDRDDIREEREEFRDARRELRDDLRERRQDGVYDDRRGYGYRNEDSDRVGSNDRDGYNEQRRFRGDRYYYPRGYSYRGYRTGAYLPRAYWGSQYFIGRPAYYGLGNPYAGTRWVRVGPDALLIRVRNGVVLRVVRGLYY